MMRARWSVVCLCLSLAIECSAQDRSQARSMVISEQGIVATSQTLASQAGAQVLARGGSAVDAAIAANAVMQVVEPMSNGIGGDLFAIYWDASTGKLSGINASGWAPRALTIDYLKGKGNKEMPALGIDTVTVPGCVDGWAKLHQRFGRLPWADLFRPAVYFASHGFPVTEIIHDYWQSGSKKLASDPNAAAVFLPQGHVPATGEVFRNPQLAHALEVLAKEGRNAFYRGEIGAALLRTSEKHGGVLSAADLAEYSAEWVTPVSTTYRGWTVYELPPNGQGIATLEMLNLMERFPLSGLGFESPEAFHVKIEAQKLAYQDLRRFVADMRFSKVPVTELLSKDYARQRAQLIDQASAHCDVTPGDPLRTTGDTIYLSVIDKDGNIVSLIQSLYMGFGSGLVTEGMGFHLQNRGALFDLDPALPNALAPRKRPFHTIIPGFMEKGDVHIGFGIMGGLNQAQAHAQFVSNVVDHGMNVQAALEAPRFTKQNFAGCDVAIEQRVPARTRDELTRRGHKLDVRGDYSGMMGGGQAVVRDAAGVHYGASSPRKDGAAVPEPAPYFAESGR
ncbi:MAG TPA: gamma-glutamyltransferase [Bryobacteraceae bacterium]|nr:gamma-glutamyltransferase [Bryobacteraceae bacterium]